jgi:hypothetical protein
MALDLGDCPCGVEITMDWTAVGAVGEVFGAVAVFATLLYLSLQVRAGNKQAELEGLRRAHDGFNEWMEQVVGSKQTASLLRRGRESAANLDPDEWLQFEYLHIHLLNTLEGWYRSIEQTSRDPEYRETQVANFEAAVQVFLSYPATREVWETYRVAFPLIEEIVDRSLLQVADGSAPE